MSVLDLYKQPVALDRVAHKSLKVTAPTDASFAASAHSIAVAGAEFVQVAKEFPIVFARDNTRLIPVAVTGLKEAENLFVGADRKWKARYVPAFIRQYPFILAQISETEMTLCIDEASPSLSHDEGMPLFDEEGKNTSVLDNAVKFLDEFHANLAATAAVLAEVEAAGLLRAIDVRFDLPDGQTFNLTGCLVVDEKATAEVTDKQALKLLRNGAMHLIHLHWASLTNFTTLLDLKNQHREE